MPLIFKVFAMQNIKVLDDKKLRVFSPKGSLKAASQSEVIFQLNNLKNLLPSVVVKVYIYAWMYIFYLMIDTMFV
jgi:hypothetical protein